MMMMVMDKSPMIDGLQHITYKSDSIEAQCYSH